ncbi:MAG: hypothetical protein AAF989_09980, partial [Planctomycetota bacterium]
MPTCFSGWRVETVESNPSNVHLANFWIDSVAGDSVVGVDPEASRLTPFRIQRIFCSNARFGRKLPWSAARA